MTDVGRGPGHRRLLVWQVVETAGFEAAWLTLDGTALHVSGQAAGQLPEPYWLTYELDTAHRAVTTRLKVTAATAGTQRHLDLSRHDGTWTVNGQARPDLAGALDCDLACSPVTNTMPIIRHGLQHGPGTERFIMAFVQVPGLVVVASCQAYTHLGLLAGAARVRYASGSFTSDLTVDTDGLVIDYHHGAPHSRPGNGSRRAAGQRPRHNPPGQRSRVLIPSAVTRSARKRDAPQHAAQQSLTPGPACTAPMRPANWPPGWPREVTPGGDDPARLRQRTRQRQRADLPN